MSERVGEGNEKEGRCCRLADWVAGSSAANIVVVGAEWWAQWWVQWWEQRLATSGPMSERRQFIVFLGRFISDLQEIEFFGEGRAATLPSVVLLGRIAFQLFPCLCIFFFFARTRTLFWRWSQKWRATKVESCFGGLDGG